MFRADLDLEKHDVLLDVLLANRSFLTRADSVMRMPCVITDNHYPAENRSKIERLPYGNYPLVT